MFSMIVIMVMRRMIVDVPCFSSMWVRMMIVPCYSIVIGFLIDLIYVRSVSGALISYLGVAIEEDIPVIVLESNKRWH